METGTEAQFGLAELVRIVEAGNWPGFKPKGKLTAEARSFISQFVEDADADELRGLTPEQFVALAHDFWIWANSGSGDAHMMRISSGAETAPGLERDILDIAGPDMGFLVDSIMGELGAAGHNALALFHPIVTNSAGAKYSLIQIHLDPLGPSQRDNLLRALALTLSDVRLANADFQPMRTKMRAAAEELAKARANVAAEELAESVAFLRWLEADHFVFLGARDYQFARDNRGEFVPEEPIILEETGLGLLRDPERYVLRRGSEPSMITPQIQRFLGEPTPVIVSKSNLMSRVHRRVYSDYVGVKRYDKRGDVIGETRFVGLFTAEAYNQQARDVPLLGRKVRRVLQRANKDPASHNGKALQNIVENYPRDELFQISEEELLQTSLAILHLFDRPKPKVFVRRDRFDRYISAMVFVPKERFNAGVREAIGEALARAYKGRVSAFYPSYGDAPLARIHYIIGRIPRGVPDPDIVALNVEIAALTRTWEDSFLAAAAQSEALEEAAANFLTAFTAGYKERFDAAEALRDIEEIGKFAAGETVRVRAYPNGDGRPDWMSCKIYAKAGALSLSACIPVLEDMGLFVEQELTYPVRAKTGAVFHIHDIEMRSRDGKPIDFRAVEDSFEDAFVAIWTGRAESDGFNALILKLGVSWREAALVRALARFRQQTGIDPTQPVQEEALAAYPEIVRLILALFRVRFAPELPESVSDRSVWAKQLEDQIEQALGAVASLDADRVLRRLARLVSGILRTNFYQPAADGGFKPYMSFKIGSRELEDLPAPKPYREIWVSSPEVEGVHLRFGPVARGGLRWSDRRDDFRTEVLDLVKAQQVKNAIIVPVGAKGGFFPKRLPPRTDPNWGEVGKEAYRTFLRGLLDITDNIVDDQIRPPRDVVRWDGDDPYLVVAADKGTATFSDTANAISAEYGHWLGDAFASGGSVGYDHKGMGITARGAWEAVKRHFRELGKDIQTTPFTVIGVGDMSGDVFGNGMLLSRQIKLIAAFDHRDIFFDPDPDPAISFEERRRLFGLPRSSWRDYDASLISEGGGIFSRSEKSIPVSAELAALTGLRQSHAAPSEILSALLKSPCELLWFGGIGTYVKARSESNAEVGDKANDAHRVNAAELKALVIGEGANLGVTQAGRIEFARKGGRINTDAVDNSAGVDTSDHEVNIKILLAEALRTGALPAAEREPLLQAMTDDVARLVLRHNYDQTLALSIAEAAARPDLDSAERFMQRLEGKGKLSRIVEGLPTTEEVRALREKALGLTRPELAKLVAYAKIDVFDSLVDSPVPDDPHFAQTLVAYFPPQLGRFSDAMSRHRLRREIIATRLADELVNRGGPTFLDRVRETVRATAPAIARAFVIARAALRADELGARVNALDNGIPAARQIEMHQEIGRTLARATIYLVRRESAAARSVGQAIEFYRPAIDTQRAEIWDTMTAQERERAEMRAERFAADGAPGDLALDAGALAALVGAFDVADLAEQTGWAVSPASRVFRAVGAFFAFDRLRGAAAAFVLEQHWDRLALRRTLEELYEDQRLLASLAIRHAGPTAAVDAAKARALVAAWAEAGGDRVAATLATIRELETGGPWSFAKAILAGAELRGLSSSLTMV